MKKKRKKTCDEGGGTSGAVVPVQKPNEFRKVFGAPLDEAVKMTDPLWLVPGPIRQAVDFLNSKALEREGLYRVPGNETRMNEYIAVWNKGEQVCFADTDFKEAAGLIVKFFRHLPEVVFTNKLQQQFMVATNRKQIRAAVHKLPVTNRETLRMLCLHFSKLSEHSATNKMSIENISICMGPTFSSPFRMMIQNVHTVFPDTVVFGRTYEEAAKISDPEGLIPSPVRTSIEFLNSTQLDLVQFYSQPGDIDKVRQYVVQFNSGTPVTYADTDGSEACAVLLRFFKQAAEPLFTEELQPEFLNTKVLELDEQKAALRELLGRLPKVNLAVAKLFTMHLMNIIKHSCTNKFSKDLIEAGLGVPLGTIFRIIVEHDESLFDGLGQ